jgi:hypothetical protein
VIARLALVVGLACARIAAADPETDADRAFRAATTQAIAGDAGAIDAFEALGATRPVTRWTDDAWAEASRLAERANDFARARRALEQVIAVGTDEVLVRRARASLARLVTTTGGGTWDAVAREHARHVNDIHDGGDPKAALAALERLVGAHARYPQITGVRLAIAQGWEIEGEADRARSWYRMAATEAQAADRQRAGLAHARALIRMGELEDAHATLDALAAARDADRVVIADLRATLATAQTRATIRSIMWVVIGLLLVVAGLLARRDAGSWRAVAGVARQPPSEALFLAPIATILVIIAQTGNPLVATAVTIIAIAAVIVTYVSGVVLEAARRKHGALAASRIAIHALGIVVAIGASIYIAVDRDRVIELLEETWEHGPAR